MTMRRSLSGLLLAVSALALCPCAASAQSPGERLRGALERAEASTFSSGPERQDAESRMAFGIARFVVAVEGLAQGLHRYGLMTPANPFLPVLRLPIPPNARPERVDYGNLRAVYQRFLDDLATARTALLAVPVSEAKIIIDLYQVRLRVSEQPGSPFASMSLADLMGRMGWGGGARSHGNASARADGWTVAFDRSDMLWLAGYTHVLSAMFEFVLAHDWRTTFDATAHLFFAGAVPPGYIADAMPPTGSGLDPQRAQGAMMGGIADQIALLHLIRWPAGDKVRMQRAKAHLKGMIATSRAMWVSILAETDDDREWLPSPTQQSRAVPSLPITPEMVTGWQSALDTFEAVLDGKLLVPHWRLNKGIDLSKLFDDPQPFDAVLWVTGHGAVPFMRDGPVIGQREWRAWNATFRGNFLGYMIYIN